MSARKITPKKSPMKTPIKKVAKKAPPKTVAKKAAPKNPTAKAAAKKATKNIAKKVPGKLSRAAGTLGAMAKKHGVPLLKTHGKTIARVGIGELQKRIKNPAIKSGLSIIRKWI